MTSFFKLILFQALEKNLIKDKSEALQKIQKTLKFSLFNLDLHKEYLEINKIYSFLKEVKTFLKDKQEEILKCQETNILIAKKGKSEIDSKIIDSKMQSKLGDYINYDIGLNNYIIHSSLLNLIEGTYSENYLESLKKIKEQNKKTIISFQALIHTEKFSDLLLPLLNFLGYNYRFIHNTLCFSEPEKTVKEINSTDSIK